MLKDVLDFPVYLCIIVTVGVVLALYFRTGELYTPNGRANNIQPHSELRTVRAIRNAQ